MHDFSNLQQLTVIKYFFSFQIKKMMKVEI